MTDIFIFCLLILNRKIAAGWIECVGAGDRYKTAYYNCPNSKENSLKTCFDSEWS